MAVKLPFVSESVQDILLWKDIKKSAIVLATVSLAYFLLGSGLSPLTPSQLVACVVLVCIPAAWVWHTASPYLGSLCSRTLLTPFTEAMQTGISQEEGRQIADSALQYVNPVLGFVGTALSGEDFKLSCMLTAGAYMTLRILGYVSFLTMVYIGVVLAFILPKLYETKQKEVDEIVGFLWAKAQEVQHKVDEVVFKKMGKSPAQKSE